MNVNALILFLVMLGGLLLVPLFSYGGQALDWLRAPSALRALAGRTAPGYAEAEAARKSALDRLNDDGGNQSL